MHPKRFAIRGRVGDEKDQDVEPRIALLENDLPLDGLHISQLHLRLHADQLTTEPRSSVERPKSPGIGIGTSISQSRDRQAGAKPSEQSQVTGVTNGVPSWEGAKCRLESDSDAGERDLREGDALDTPALDSPERCVIHAYSRRSGAQAGTGVCPRNANLRSDLSTELVRNPERPIAASLARGHCASVAAVAYRPVTPRRIPRCA